MRRIFDNHSHFGEPVADLVGAGEVSGGSCRGALLDQA
jgi:hypothetical protein